MKNRIAYLSNQKLAFKNQRSFLAQIESNTHLDPKIRKISLRRTRHRRRMAQLKLPWARIWLSRFLLHSRQTKMKKRKITLSKRIVLQTN